MSFNGKNIFDRLNFYAAKGDKVAILGKSGLGKSSFLKLILGFISPQSGQILFNNIPVNERTIWDIRKKISFVDQDVSLGKGRVIDWLHGVFNFKANDSVGFPREKLKQLCEYFELTPEDLHKNIDDLSGGEKQRLAIIVSVLLKRELFLFDEVTSSLDADLKAKTADYFVGDKERTVIVISHDPAWLKYPQVKKFDLKEQKWKQ